MSRPAHFRALLGLTAVLLVAALPATAGEVYRWKDAKGVTHYSDAPPKDSAYKKSTVNAGTPQAGQAPAAEKAEKAEKAADSPQCTASRQNLERLKSNAPVGLDANNDGKPDAELSADQRADQVQLAEAGIKAWCTPTASATP